MSISVVATSGDGSQNEDFRYQDGEDPEYLYVIGDNRTLAIYGKETNGRLEPGQQPGIIYGPAAWFSVSGDTRTRAIEPVSRSYSGERTELVCSRGDLRGRPVSWTSSRMRCW